MKKQILISILSLTLVSSLNASQGVLGEHCFRPAFQKKLKRVNSVKGGSFRSLSLKKKVGKKEVFIDWRKLYWGKLSDLIYSEEETYTDDVHEIAGTEGQDIGTSDSQESQVFATELRQELKSFARQYNLKIVWRTKSPDITDGTAAFLEYWDKGYSQEEQGKALPFAQLYALSIRDTSTKERAAKVTTVKAADIQPQFKDISYANPYLKKGA